MIGFSQRTRNNPWDLSSYCLNSHQDHRFAEVSKKILTKDKSQAAYSMWDENILNLKKKGYNTVPSSCCLNLSKEVKISQKWSFFWSSSAVGEDACVPARNIREKGGVLGEIKTQWKIRIKIRAAILLEFLLFYLELTMWVLVFHC